MGYRNVDDFVSNPKALDLLKQLLHMVLTMMHGGQIDPSIVNVIEQVGQLFGIFPKQQQGQQTGTQPGEVTPEAPQEPQNELNLPESIPAPGYFG